MGSLIREHAISAGGVRGRIAASLIFTAVTAVSAQIAIPLGFTPVPITLQVLVVLLSGLTLGSRWGAVSQMQYLALGALGLPVFAGWNAGPVALWGPTAGYLIGFVPAAFLAGWAIERAGSRRGIGAWLGGVLGIAAIYLCGASWLVMWMSVISLESVGLAKVWALGVAPFIGVDLLKALAASGLSVAGRSGSSFLRSLSEGWR